MIKESLDKLEKLIANNVKPMTIPPKPQFAAEKKEIGGPLLRIELPVLDKVKRVSAREISQKYKIPHFSQLKRLTPIPGGAQPVKFDLNTQILTVESTHYAGPDTKLR